MADTTLSQRERAAIAGAREHGFVLENVGTVDGRGRFMIRTPGWIELNEVEHFLDQLGGAEVEKLEAFRAAADSLSDAQVIAQLEGYAHNVKLGFDELTGERVYTVLKPGVTSNGLRRSLSIEQYVESIEPDDTPPRKLPPLRLVQSADGS